MKVSRELIDKLNASRALLDECISMIQKGTESIKQPKKIEKPVIIAHGEVDLNMPLRAFAKRHAKGRGGPAKFTILLARLVEGVESKTIPLSTIADEWSKMTSILGGGFNRFYSNQARERDWVTTTKTGNYQLRPSWREALK